MSAQPAYDPSIERLVSSAVATVQMHEPASDGFCAGCLTLWGRLAWYPCTQAQWAYGVLDEHAVNVTRRMILDALSPRRESNPRHLT